MGTKNFDNALDLITFSRTSGGTALRKISYGSEIFPNGNFDDGGTGWSLSAQSVVANGVGNVISTDGSYQYIAESLAVTAGKVYLLAFDLVERSSGTPRVSLTGAVSGSYSISTSLGDKQIAFVAASTGSVNIYFDRAGGVTDYKFDNASLKEVLFDQPDGTLTLFNHPAQIPRIEYAADGTVKGLLVEEQRTNLITYSEDFTNAAWTKVQASVVTGQAAPDGTSNAFSLIENATTSYHEVYTVPSPATTTHTASVYAKQGVGSRHLQLRPVNEGSGVAHANFDLANGVVGTTGGTAFVAATIEDAGSGWYRCSLSLTYTLSGAGVGLNLVTSPSAVERESYAGDNTSSIYIYGAQLEAGAFPTSYIPTAGSTVTRAADIASIPVSAFGYNQKAGTLLIEASEFDATAIRFAAGVGYDGSNYIGLLYVSGTNSYVQPTAVSIGTVSQPSNTFVKSAAAFNSSSSASATSGTVATDVGSSPTGSNAVLYLGSSPFSPSTISSCHIKSISYYPRRLSNAQLQELTS